MRSGLGQVPILFTEERRAKQVLQRLEGIALSGAGPLGQGDAIDQADIEGIGPAAVLALGFDGMLAGGYLGQTAQESEELLEEALPAAPLSGYSLGQRKKKGFFKKVTKFAGKALPAVGAVAGFVGIPGAGAITGLLQNVIPKPKARKTAAEAVIAHRAIQQGGGCTTQVQDAQARTIETALLQSPEGARELERARVSIAQRAEEDSGVGREFAAVTRPPRRPAPRGFFSNLFGGFGRRRRG